MASHNCPKQPVRFFYTWKMLSKWPKLLRVKRSPCLQMTRTFKAGRYGAMVTSLSLPAVEVWRTYRGRADCE